MIHIADPGWLWLLAILPVLAFWRGKRGSAPAVEYPSGEILKKVAGQRRNQAGKFLAVLRLLSLGFLIIALARPQLGRQMTEVESSGIDMVLAVDVSGSMEAMDFKWHGKPVSRLEVVKAVVGKFIEERPHDRIALVAFAGQPYLVSPLTLDHDWLLKNIERVHIGMVEDGTAIGSAIATSVNRLKDQKAKSKIVILLTDGVSNAGKVTPLTAAEAARALGTRVYTIGAGTRGQAPMPVVDAFGRQRLMMVPVEVDEATLKEIANMTGGKYFRATDTDSLRAVYTEIDQMEKTTRKLKRFQSYRDLYIWFLVPGILLLGLEILLGSTLFRRLP